MNCVQPYRTLSSNCTEEKTERRDVNAASGAVMGVMGSWKPGSVPGLLFIGLQCRRGVLAGRFSRCVVSIGQKSGTNLPSTPKMLQISDFELWRRLCSYGRQCVLCTEGISGL